MNKNLKFYIEEKARQMKVLSDYLKENHEGLLYPDCLSILIKTENEAIEVAMYMNIYEKAVDDDEYSQLKNIIRLTTNECIKELADQFRK